MLLFCCMVNILRYLGCGYCDSMIGREIHIDVSGVCPICVGISEVQSCAPKAWKKPVTPLNISWLRTRFPVLNVDNPITSSTESTDSFHAETGAKSADVFFVSESSSPGTWSRCVCNWKASWLRGIYALLEASFNRGKVTKHVFRLGGFALIGRPVWNQNMNSDFKPTCDAITFHF